MTCLFLCIATIGQAEPLSTVELEEYLANRISGESPWTYEIDRVAAKRIYGIADSDDFSFFSYKQKLPNGVEIEIADHLMQRQWSVSGSDENLLPPEDAYNHIIKLHDGRHQPDLDKFAREGDIIVYWHPEYQDPITTPTWRATHASTLMRGIDQRDGVARLLTIDSPVNYGKFFDGRDDVPFHIFRIIATPDGHYDEAVEKEYQSQIAKWGSLGFGKFDFQGDYDTLISKDFDSLAPYAAGYLSQTELPAMYCSWYAYVNVRLGLEMPLNLNGLAALAEPLPVTVLQSEEPLNLRSRLHTYGTGFWDSYKADPQLPAMSDPLFHPYTALEIIDAWLNRYVPGHTPEMHQVRSQFLTGMIPAFEAKFIQPIPSRSVYNSTLTAMIRAMPRKLAEDSTIANRDGKSPSSYQIWLDQQIATLRSMPDSPRWIVPFSFMAEAEKISSNELNHPQAKIVYVGTAIHQKFLKLTGTPDGSSPPYHYSDELPQALDQKLDDHKILKALGQPNIPESSALEAMWQQLVSEGSTSELFGVNPFEVASLTRLRNAWVPDEEEFSNNSKLNDHNNFGIGPVVWRRIVVSLWNDPKVVRVALNSSQGNHLGNVAKNLRVLFSDPPIGIYHPRSRKPHRDTGHPRLTSWLPCIVGAAPSPPAECTSNQ
jgi:hypothetical protein